MSSVSIAGRAQRISILAIIKKINGQETLVRIYQLGTARIWNHYHPSADFIFCQRIEELSIAGRDKEKAGLLNANDLKNVFRGCRFQVAFIG